MGKHLLGKDRVIRLSRDGTDSGEMVELECQGGSTINTGKSASRSKMKNCVVSSVQEDGMSISAQFKPERPAPEGQDLVYQAHDTGEPWYCEIFPKKPGVRGWRGYFIVIIPQEEDPEDGTESTVSVEFSQSGDEVTKFVSA